MWSLSIKVLNPYEALAKDSKDENRKAINEK